MTAPLRSRVSFFSPFAFRGASWGARSRRSRVSAEGSRDVHRETQGHLKLATRGTTSVQNQSVAIHSSWDLLCAACCVSGISNGQTSKKCEFQVSILPPKIRTRRNAPQENLLIASFHPIITTHKSVKNLVVDGCSRSSSVWFPSLSLLLHVANLDTRESQAFLHNYLRDLGHCVGLVVALIREKICRVSGCRRELESRAKKKTKQSVG